MSNYKWIEDSTEDFYLDIRARVKTFFYIDRGPDGKVTGARFSHCRFKIGEEVGGYVNLGPALCSKDLGDDFCASLEREMNKSIKNGDLDEVALAALEECKG